MRTPITATCPVCGRRYRSPGDAPWCTVGCMAAAYREPEPEPAPVPDVGRGRAARTVRRPLSPREMPDPSAAR
jgi:hypothetical protein